MILIYLFRLGTLPALGFPCPPCALYAHTLPILGAHHNYIRPIAKRWQPLTTIIRRVARVKRNLPDLEYFLYTGRVTETTEQTLLGGNEVYRLKTVQYAKSSDLNINRIFLAENARATKTMVAFIIYQALKRMSVMLYTQQLYSVLQQHRNVIALVKIYQSGGQQSGSNLLSAYISNKREYYLQAAQNNYFKGGF